MYTASIYSIFNSISNTIYIGQTLRDPNHRWREHRYSFSSSKKKGVNSHLKASYAKYGKEAFTFSVIEYKAFALLEEAKIWANTQEEANITKQRELGIELYNIRPSCISNAGCVRSEALKQQVSKKCSLALKGRLFTQEHKRNISLAKKGKVSSQLGVPRKDDIWNKGKKNDRRI
jgi:group I intron endonuclease